MHRVPPPVEAPHCDAPAGACAETALPATGRGAVVWLRSNHWPGVGIAGMAAALLLVVLLASRPWSRPVGVVPWLLGGGLGVAGAAGLILSSRPRIVLVGKGLRVHLAPARVEVVPLEVVECFFLGSRLEPPHPGDVRTGGDRVRTLVMRIAERAVDHAERPTLPLWGAWREGSVTFDGRWCEPLSVDLVRRLNRDLTTAKRAALARGGT